MNKKAEERALETYPDPEFDGYFDDIYVTRQSEAARSRSRYIEGYEQAEKDMIERACNYLYDHRQGNRDVYQFIGLFRKAMEEGL